MTVMPGAIQVSIMAIKVPEVLSGTLNTDHLVYVYVGEGGRKAALNYTIKTWPKKLYTILYSVMRYFY